MRRFGLIGYPLGHSFSKGFFTDKFNKEKLSDCSYSNYELNDITQFPNLINENAELQGLNVTIPHKQTVIEYLDELDEAASVIGAVNTIKVRSGKLTGYNTDYIGFKRSIGQLLKAHHKKALILGTGGSSLAVQYSLKLLGIEYHFVSRNPKRDQLGYHDITEEILSDYAVIINTTPLGMHPAIDTAPDIPYQYLTDQHLLYDLVYNPEETLFLQRGKEKGASTKNGLEMLQIQAKAAWGIWTDY